MIQFKLTPFKILAGLSLLLLITPSHGQGKIIDPVTPNASPEAKSLLHYIQSISGTYTLSGQHNFPISGDKNSIFAGNYYGKMPIVWSMDFGFAKEGDKDSYLMRQSNVAEAIRQYKAGAIVNFCWHAVPPTADEPVTFQPVQGSDPNAPLASVQGHFTEKQLKELLTKGTNLHKHWLEQIDVIASYLKQLQDAHVPVLWRPYHEMNGDWFWWGGHYEGKYTTAELYRQIFDRFVNYHKLNNLVWVWSVDRPSRPDREFSKYYPGNQYLDILALDVYGSDFSQAYYDSLMALSNGKPITLAEVGVPPTMEVLEKQPNWTWWVIWSGMVEGTPKDQFRTYTGGSRVLFMEDPEYKKGIENLRAISGFTPLPLHAPADFNGEWNQNECESRDISTGFSSAPYKLEIVQKPGELTVKSISHSEWSDDETTHETLKLDGSDNNSTVFNNSLRVKNARWSDGKDTLIIDSKTTFNFDGNSRDIKSKELWTNEWLGKKLVIRQTVDSFRGEPGTSVLVYDKQ